MSGTAHSEAGFYKMNTAWPPCSIRVSHVLTTESIHCQWFLGFWSQSCLVDSGVKQSGVYWTMVVSVQYWLSILVLFCLFFISLTFVNSFEQGFSSTCGYIFFLLVMVISFNHFIFISEKLSISFGEPVAVKCVMLLALAWEWTPWPSFS